MIFEATFSFPASPCGEMAGVRISGSRAVIFDYHAGESTKDVYAVDAGGVRDLIVALECALPILEAIEAQK